MVNQSLSHEEIAIECLRIAAEFSSEYDRADPITKAQSYMDWVLKVSGRKSLDKTAAKKV